MKFSITDFFSNQNRHVELVIFTEEILNGKLNFLYLCNFFKWYSYKNSIILVINGFQIVCWEKYSRKN